LIGEKLAHYEITGLLGKGGMGEVYLARDNSLGRDVALKVLPPELATDPDRLERFQREAKALAALDHPNIVTVHSVEEADGVHFITMGLVEGKSLDELIPGAGLQLDKFFEIAIPLAEALSAAHGKGITHRDLKPQNIMITAEDGRVKVLDFGLAKQQQTGTGDLDMTQHATEALTQEGVVVGTVPYMSPEQLEGKPLDRRTDIFSLGVILYEMASGQRPFQGESGASLVSSILRDPPPPLTGPGTELPYHLGRVILRCLEKDPKRRYQAALDVRNELEGLKKEVESGVRDPSSAEVSAPPSPRPRRWWLAAGGLALVAISAAWWIKEPAKPADEAQELTDASTRNMTVVFPFENRGPAEDAYFAAGMTDEISARLASVEGLGVISRNSAKRYGGSDKTMRQIGDELGVDYVLEGTVQWAKTADGPSRVRITPHLVRVDDDSQIWSQVYDREMADVFAVQTEIAKAVVAAIDSSLVPAAEALAEEEPTKSLEAYDDYLQAKAISTGVAIPQERLKLATVHLEQAIALDPDFALAHAALSEIHSAYFFRGWDPTDTRLQMALRSAERALELQPGLAAAHQALGVYHYRGFRAYGQAIASFERARALEPSNAELLFWLGVIAKRQGRFEEGLGYLERARRLDPRNGRILGETSLILGFLGRHREAVEWGDRLVALELDSRESRLSRAFRHFDGTGTTSEMHAALEGTTDEEHVSVLITALLFDRDYRGVIEKAALFPVEPTGESSSSATRKLSAALAHRALGEESLARRLASDALPLLERRAAESPRYHGPLGVALAILGRRDAAVAAAEQGVERVPLAVDAHDAGHIVYDLAHVHVLVGEPQAALEQLERFLGMTRHWSTDRVGNDPIWDPIRGDPRFQALLEKQR